jgi:hypothetical protein
VEFYFTGGDTADKGIRVMRKAEYWWVAGREAEISQQQ